MPTSARPRWARPSWIGWPRTRLGLDIGEPVLPIALSRYLEEPSIDAGPGGPDTPGTQGADMRGTRLPALMAASLLAEVDALTRRR